MRRPSFARPATAAEAHGTEPPRFNPTTFAGQAWQATAEDRLPPRARDRYHRIREMARDMSLVARSARDAANDAITLREQRARELRHVTENLERMLGRTGDVTERPEHQRAQAAFDRAAADATRARDVADRKAERSAPIIALAQQLERSLDRISPDLTDDETRARMKKGEGHDAALERIRREIGSRRADAQAVRTAPTPSSEAIALMHQQVDALAKRGAPDCFGLVEQRGDIAFPTLKAKITRWTSSSDGSRTVLDPTAGHADSPDALAVLAWLARDDLKAALETEIRQIADDANALTPAERQTRLAALEADIAELEREAARIAWDWHEEHGADLALSDISDPAIVLGIAPAPPTART